MSHTAKIKVEFLNQEAFRAAAAACGYTWIGEGRHQFYRHNRTDGWADGLGFSIPGWSYPAVLTAEGTLAFDDSSRQHYGRTAIDGKIPEFDRLTARYAIEAARLAAQAQGWTCMDQQDGSLLILHPDGGSLTVTSAGEVDANGFVGGGCAAATAAIGEALGKTLETVAKPEYYVEFAHISEGAR